MTDVELEEWFESLTAEEVEELTALRDVVVREMRRSCLVRSHVVEGSYGRR